MAGTDFLSKRFLLKRFLGLSEEELTENDRLWAEENGASDFDRSSAEDLRSVGVTPGDLNTDFDTLDAETPDIEGGDVDIDTGGDDAADVDIDTGDET